MSRLPLVAGAAGAALAAWMAARPRLLNRGATAGEAARPLPGDDLLPHAGPTSTMAATLPAPPDRVWPWLVQMGCGRAGWYSHDRLDNGGVPSADRLLPEHQGLREGDRVPSTPSGRSWFTVARLDAPRALVYRFRGTLAGRMLDDDERLPWGGLDSTWAFVLEPAPGGATRLLVRTRGTGRPWWLPRLSGVLFWDAAHLIMQRRQLAGLAGRVAGG